MPHDDFEALNNFISLNNLDWQRCVCLSTDEVGSMAGKRTDLISRVKSVAPKVKWTYCFIHREALAVKQISEDLETTLSAVVKIFTYIK